MVDALITIDTHSLVVAALLFLLRCAQYPVSLYFILLEVSRRAVAVDAVLPVGAASIHDVNCVEFGRGGAAHCVCSLAASLAGAVAHLLENRAARSGAFGLTTLNSGVSGVIGSLPLDHSLSVVLGCLLYVLTVATLIIIGIGIGHLLGALAVPRLRRCRPAV